MKCADIPAGPILSYLAHQARGKPATHWEAHGTNIPSVYDAMPPDTPAKLRLAKMRALLRRGLVDGCDCGCRGDWTITDKGRVHLDPSRLA